MTKKNNYDKPIEGHEYDGIKELDNKLPPWWLYLFYLSIIWAIAYFLYFHVLGIGDSSFEEYMKEIDPQWTEAQVSHDFQIGYRSPFFNSEEDLTPLRREQIKKDLAEAAAIRAADKLAEKQMPVTDMNFDDLIISAMRVATDKNREILKQAFPELFAVYQSQSPETQVELADKKVISEPETPIEPLTDEKNLSQGKNIYEINCATCHGKLGEGGIGPNLADDYFIHGAGMASTVRIINQGVAAKGMISWRGILKDDQIMQVSSYVVSLYGSNPPNAKGPQGEKVTFAEKPN